MIILKDILHIFMEDSEQVSALHINQGSKHITASGRSGDMNTL